MVFVRRAATVALLTFASALAGFAVRGFLPASYVIESRSMVGSVVGLVASLLSLVLSLLIWTSHGLFTTQQSQLQTIGRSIIQLDFALTGYGSEATQGRALLHDHVKRLRARLWDDGLAVRRAFYHAALPEDVLGMHDFFVSLYPTNDEQKRALTNVRDLFGSIVDMQMTIVRGVVDRVPKMLLNIVLGWSCLLFLRLRPAIDIRRGDRRPGRARRHGCRERSLSDSRIKRPLLALLWQIYSRRLERFRLQWGHR